MSQSSNSSAASATPSIAAYADDKGRVDWVDYAKGFCIIFVVMMHSVLGVEARVDDTGWMHALVQFAKPFRMPDFFMISGLFLGLVIARPWRRYIDRRVIHFFYFYALWVTIQFLVKAPGWMMEGMTPVGALGEWAFAFVQPFGTLWFIYILPVFAVFTRLTRPVPWPILLAGVAVLEILMINTGWTMIDEFAARYVYFLAGYLFASNIFAFADWGKRHRGLAIGVLAAWVVINGIFTFWPLSAETMAYYDDPEHIRMVSDLPIVSLVLGVAGAVGVILLTTLLSTLNWMGFLAWLGRHSIVVYLSFFLPMAIARTILLRFATPWLDIGTISLLVTIAGVVGPVILYGIVQFTGYGRFLFERPDWARLKDKPAHREASGESLKPAE